MFDKLTRLERIKVLVLDDSVIKRNRYKKSECLYLLSTDCSLSSAEIVRVYGNRCFIECFFKVCKSLMKLGTEFQSRSYDVMASHTTIVFTRYIILEWIRRNENDQKTYGELFYMFCDDIQDMDLTNALQSLMALFVDTAAKISTEITDLAKSKVTDWIMSQTLFIPASNEPSRRACTDIWRMPRGSNTPQLCCDASLMPRQLAAGYLTQALFRDFCGES